MFLGTQDIHQPEESSQCRSFQTQWALNNILIWLTGVTTQQFICIFQFLHPIIAFHASTRLLFLVKLFQTHASNKRLITHWLTAVLKTCLLYINIDFYGVYFLLSYLHWWYHYHKIHRLVIVFVYYHVFFFISFNLAVLQLLGIKFSVYAQTLWILMYVVTYSFFMFIVLSSSSLFFTCSKVFLHHHNY